MMTHAELDQRARQRSIDEGLHTFRLAGRSAYLVKSRKSDPGSMHVVTVEDGQVTNCSDCKGWEYRQSCIHAQAVTRRLEREGKLHDVVKFVPDMPIVSSCRSRWQIFQEEN
jgi:hypothetical protein